MPQKCYIREAARKRSLKPLVAMMKYVIYILLILTLVNCATVQNYDDIYSYQDNYAKVRVGAKFGIIDTAANIVIPPVLDEIISYESSPYFFDSWLYGKRNDSIIIYDTAGSNLHNYLFSNEYYPFLLSDQSWKTDSIIIRSTDQVYYVNGNKNWGCITISGDTIVPFIYDQIEPGINGDFIATRGGERSLETHLYNKSGALLRRTYNVPIKAWRTKGLYWVIYSNQNVELRDIELDKFDLIDKYEYQDVIVAGSNCWIKTENQYQLIDISMSPIGKSYDNVLMNIHWGVAWEGKTAVILNINGKLISKPKYIGDASDYISNSRYIVAKNKEYIDILDHEGNLISRIKRNATNNG